MSTPFSAVTYTDKNMIIHTLLQKPFTSLVAGCISFCQALQNRLNTGFAHVGIQEMLSHQAID